MNNEDGTERNFLLQLECKLDIDFNNSADRAKVLLQVCCYLRQIHDDICGFTSDWKSSDIPVVVVLGSKINCMALHTKWLLPFAQSHIVGYKGASTAYLKDENKQLLLNIENDSNIQVNSIVYDVNDKDCIKNICDSILKLGQGISITDDLTENNISKAFDFFDMYVLDKKQANKLTSRQKVDLFIGTFYSADFREDKTDRWAINADIIRLHGVEIKVDPIKYNNFKLVFNMRPYSKLEQKRITAITDRLIDDTDRRRKGDFYTPSIWVDEAHKLLSKNLGSNWKEEYMVWDCAWGTGNLTRDYRFKDLYCSTLHNEDLNIGTRYNQDACKFQYDFLNDDVEEFEDIESTIKSALSMRSTDMNLATSMFESAMNQLRATKLYKCAPGLIDGLMGWNGKEKKKLLFFINPPYGASTNVKNTVYTGDAKVGTNESNIRNQMIKNNIGAASQNLYLQFIYRINELIRLFNIEAQLGIFCPPAYITGKNAKKFREYIKLWVYASFMLQASQFADVSDDWGITFQILKVNIDKYSEIKTLVKKVSDQGIVEDIGYKVLYNMDNKDSMTDWIRKDVKKYKAVDYPQMKSALNWSNEHRLGNLVPGSYGYLVDSGNNVDENTSRVFLLTSCRGAGHGVSILDENFTSCCTSFAARRLISGLYANWVNCKDEYMIPNIGHPLYNQWQSDSIVYSLFNNASNQSSLRNIEYNGKIWDIQNEFFWMSVRDMENLVGGLYDKVDINTKVEDDIEKFGNERFVYKKLQEVELSQDAQAVLDKATELVKLSFRFRKDFNEKHPEYHINAWDAGWYQIKGMLKEYMPNELKEFNALYKAMEDRMRPLVYELGFLYR